MENHNKLKLRVISKSNSRPQTLEIALEHRQEFPTSRRLSTDLRFIRRIRQGHVVPKSCKDTILDDAQKRDLMFQSSDNEIMIFGSRELPIHATSTTRICIDGTFSRCPKTHYQLLTCHAVCPDGFAFPFPFALLKNKKVETYSAVFNEVDRKATSLCGKVVFSRDDLVVSCDFEKGLLKAFETMRCSVKCCHFHFNLSLWRFMYKNGMASRYISDAQFRSRSRALMVLPLFPQNKSWMCTTRSTSCSTLMTMTSPDYTPTLEMFRSVRFPLTVVVSMTLFSEQTTLPSHFMLLWQEGCSILILISSNLLTLSTNFPKKP